MSPVAKPKLGIEHVALFLLLGIFAVSLGWFLLGPRLSSSPACAEDFKSGAAVEELDATLLTFSYEELSISALGSTEDAPFFSSELRVVAIGSAYPIPYAAEICPFTQAPQPSMNQLDRDGDGMTDDWEIKYGLDKYNAVDALGDIDGDGFIQLEEFREKTDPTDKNSHPDYALKLRFVKRNVVPFPFVFQGVNQVEAGKNIFQINTSEDGLSHFLALGEELAGFELYKYLPREAGVEERIVVRRDDAVVILPRGEIVDDPESHAELINILDRTPEIVTMGALLSLRNDVYTVLGVYSNRVVIKHCDTEKIYDIGSLTDEERKVLF